MGARHGRGFTLLEMMLTVALIAITATFVSFSMSGSDARLAELEARRFVALVNMALDESIMTGRPILLTIDADAKSYQFAPLDMPGIFAIEGITEGDQQEDNMDYSLENDQFFKLRQIPERVGMDFTRLPERPDSDEESDMVPQRVHEILNESLFDNERDEIDDPDENTVLIEPYGLISPFELVLSLEDRLSRVGLDTYGRATVLEHK